MNAAQMIDDAKELLGKLTVKRFIAVSTYIPNGWDVFRATQVLGFLCAVKCVEDWGNGSYYVRTRKPVIEFDEILVKLDAVGIVHLPDGTVIRKECRNECRKDTLDGFLDHVKELPILTRYGGSDRDDECLRTVRRIDEIVKKANEVIARLCMSTDLISAEDGFSSLGDVSGVAVLFVRNGKTRVVVHETWPEYPSAEQLTAVVSRVSDKCTEIVGSLVKEAGV